MAENPGNAHTQSPAGPEDGALGIHNCCRIGLQAWWRRRG